MIAGYHLIWTAYGWWLPNDPRGSSSHEIRVERIADLGEPHYGRKAVQPPASDIRQFYEQARPVLAHELLAFTDHEIEILAASFAEVVQSARYTCYACAIMPDHVHCLIRKHGDHAEQMIKALQEAGRKALIESKLRPLEHPVWGGGPGWKVFLNTRADMGRVVDYIRMNPIKAGRPAQHWPFVKEYYGWLPWQITK
jgi:REP element-mobilizing transposase RayT